MDQTLLYRAITDGAGLIATAIERGLKAIAYATGTASGRHAPSGAQNNQSLLDG